MSREAPQNIANEQRLVAANRELIERFEQKIAATLARIWSEEQSGPEEASCARVS